MPLDTYTINEIACIAATIFLVGVNKGGFPIGSLALPLLILIWPGNIEPTKTAVAFLLPILCAMDIVALIFYKKHILWNRIWPLVSGAVAGILVATPVFVPKYGGLLTIPDNAIKFCIGAVGIAFVMHRAARRWVLHKLENATVPTIMRSSLLGFVAGIVSTLSHGAGPIAQMHFLPQKLEKMQFAATLGAFFFVINLVKLVPFAACGRIEVSNLILAGYMFPVIPIGVAAGYGLVRITRPEHYVTMIYSLLFFTSILLIVKSF